MKTSILKTLGRERISKDENHSNFKKLDNLSKHLYAIFHETTLPTLLRNYDRYAMINSVEIRMPFMDHRIVSFVSSLPFTSKLGEGYTKKLVRDAIDPYLPNEVTWRKTKIGFTSPIVNWMQDDLKEWFSDTVHSSKFMESKLVDNTSELQSNIMAVVNGTTNDFVFAQNLWTKLTPYLWEQSFLERKF